MGNLIQNLIERKELEQKQANDRLIQKQNRLQELETIAQDKKAKFLHPIQTVKNKKEAESLRHEINATEEELHTIEKRLQVLRVIQKNKEERTINKSANQKDRRLWYWAGGVAAIGLIVIASFGGNNNDEKTTVPAKEMTIVETTLSTQRTAVPETIIKGTTAMTVATTDTEIKTTAVPKTTEAKSTAVTTKEETTAPTTTKETTIAETTTTETEEEYDGIALTANDLSVSFCSGYAHVSNESIYLGNDEVGTITIDSKTDGISQDDIIIYYDETLLSISIDNVVTTNGSTRIRYSVTGNQACYTEVLILTYYDVYMLGEEAPGYVINVKKYDSNDGRVCYVAQQSGECYHFDPDCGGSEVTKTTVHDALAYEYRACSKCAK